MSVKCLIYCSRGKLLERHWKKIDGIGKFILYHHSDKVKYCDHNSPHRLNGKIVASFDCEKVEKIVATKWSVCCGCVYYQFETKDLLRKSCLEYTYLCDYLENKEGYAIHISNLEIFDEPKEVCEYKGECINKKWSYCPSCKVGYEYISEDEAEFYRAYGTCSTEWVCLNWLKKAPQNMCYCYDQDRKNHYVLISIKPEWVAKILNGKKTIEVRKKVVNALKELI